MAHELKEIRYQSRTYTRLETLMNRVNETSIKEAHRKQIQRALQGHFNYYGVNGNLKQIYKFWKYVKYSYYKVLNKRHQKRSMKYCDYLRIWNFYVTEPHLTKDIWNWKPRLV